MCALGTGNYRDGDLHALKAVIETAGNCCRAQPEELLVQGILKALAVRVP
jgi:hypothetical protein